MRQILLGAALVISGCTAIATQPDTVNQKFYGLVSDYATVQNAAISYKKNCETKHLPAGCEKQVKVMQSIDKKANTIIQAAKTNTDQPGYVNASHQALTLLFNEMGTALESNQ